MRVNNSTRIYQIINLGLSEPVFRASKNFIAIGEKLKDTEQSLNFLQRCKLEQVFPVFILNSIRASGHLFPVKFSSFHQKSLFSLRKSCLNQHIQFKYSLIDQLKKDAIVLKDFLRNSTPEHFSSIIQIFHSNNHDTKSAAKTRLLNKFNWLLYKYYLPCWNDGEYYYKNFSYIHMYHQMKKENLTQPTPSPITPDQHSPSSATYSIPTPSSSPAPPPPPPTPHPPPPPTSPALAIPREKVTFVNIPDNAIDEDTVSLLSLGPGYALTPRLDERGRDNILNMVQENIAAMAINLRWRELLANTYSAKTLKQHLKSIAPFEQTHTRAPSQADAVVENKLATLKRDLMKITKTAKVTPNLTPNQRTALRNLKNNEDLHISIADKTSEFVVMPKKDQIRTTTTHFSKTGVYKKVDMPEDQVEAQKFINKLTKTLEDEVNSTFRRIAEQRKIPEDATNLLMSHHTTLPTARVMLKTHKYTGEQVKTLDR